MIYHIWILWDLYIYSATWLYYTDLGIFFLPSISAHIYLSNFRGKLSFKEFVSIWSLRDGGFLRGQWCEQWKEFLDQIPQNPAINQQKSWLDLAILIYIYIIYIYRFSIKAILVTLSLIVLAGLWRDPDFMTSLSVYIIRICLMKLGV